MNPRYKRLMYGVIFALMLLVTLLLSAAEGFEIKTETCRIIMADATVQNLHPRAELQWLSSLPILHPMVRAQKVQIQQQKCHPAIFAMNR